MQDQLLPSCNYVEFRLNQVLEKVKATEIVAEIASNAAEACHTPVQ
jgi:hypothetical protein